jgi:hypothetical protein
LKQTLNALRLGGKFINAMSFGQSKQFYVVEKVLKTKLINKSKFIHHSARFYLVKWKGYS